jgi:hypothetical protein
MKIASRVLRERDEVVFGSRPNFARGDMLESSDMSPCRYIFHIVDPAVRFETNPNADLRESDETCCICYSTMTAEERLPCGHSFCLNCIHEWARTCRASFQRIVCPICRRAFLHSQLTPNEAALRDGELCIWSVEPLLRELNVRSCRTIRGVHIFKKWSDRHRKWFWAALAKIAGHQIRKLLFLHLTKATVQHVINASQSELVQALRNFQAEPMFGNRNDNLSALLLIICDGLTRSEDRRDDIRTTNRT